jgi:hypothetical protein
MGSGPRARAGGHVRWRRARPGRRRRASPARPDRAGQQVLQPIRRGVSNVLGDGPAVLDRQVRQQPEHQILRAAARLHPANRQAIRPINSLIRAPNTLGSTLSILTRAVGGFGSRGRGRAEVAVSTARAPYAARAAYATRTGSCPAACTLPAPWPRATPAGRHRHCYEGESGDAYRTPHSPSTTYNVVIATSGSGRNSVSPAAPATGLPP